MKVKDGILFVIFHFFEILKLYRQIHRQPRSIASESFEALEHIFLIENYLKDLGLRTIKQVLITE